MKEIYYIAGTGRSGSTILDIVLGSQEIFFSLGEVHYFPEKGHLGKQYCSCGEIVPKCQLWSKVEEKWSKCRKGTIEDYLYYQNRYTRTKNILILIKNLFFPSLAFKNYIKNTKRMFDIIFELTKANYLVDSSKVPTRIIILKKIGYRINVIHLKRKFSAVLNSYKKVSKKDLKQGIEESHGASKTYVIIINWIGYNILTKLFSFKTKYCKVNYENFILEFKRTINSILPVRSESFDKILHDRGPFKNKHMVAGNKLRMEYEIYISNKPQGIILNRLSKFNLRVSRIVDFLFKWI